jgi:hypothetical protein
MNKGCNRGEKCMFGHGCDELLCKYNDNCHKKECKFLHVNRNNLEINEKPKKDEDVRFDIKISIDGKEVSADKLDKILNIDKNNIIQLEKNIKDKNNDNFSKPKKINEKEIYEKIINDEKIMSNYGKVDDSLDLLENNIDIMVKYFKEHSEIIKENLEIKSIDTELNFYNYYIENLMFLNKIIHDINLFETNCKMLLKQERIKNHENCI